MAHLWQIGWGDYGRAYLQRKRPGFNLIDPESLLNDLQNVFLRSISYTSFSVIRSAQIEPSSIGTSSSRNVSSKTPAQGSHPRP